MLATALLVLGCESTTEEPSGAARSGNPQPSATPSATAVAPAVATDRRPAGLSSRATPAPADAHSALETPYGPRHVEAGEVPGGNAWLPAFTVTRFAGDQGLSWLGAAKHCRSQAMALCTDPQWSRACDADRSLGATETWTATAQGKHSFLARGGAGGCSERRSVPGQLTPAERVAVCCSRAVAVSAPEHDPSFRAAVEDRLLELELVLAGRTANLPELLAPKVSYLGAPMTAEAMAEAVRATAAQFPGSSVLFDTCVAKPLANEPRWTADCFTLRERGESVASVLWRIDWSATSRKLEKVQEVRAYRDFTPVEIGGTSSHTAP